MKIISWNVNGLRSCVNKGFFTIVEREKPDLICVQEIKSDRKSANFQLDGYEQYWNPATRKGYAGTAVFCKMKAVEYFIGINHLFADEGRICTVSYDDFYLINCYAPHARRDLTRLQYKHEFNKALSHYVCSLNKPVIICGDMNVAHQEIDLANYKVNHGNAGFTDIERQDFSDLLSYGFVDSYRFLNPDQGGVYTWWSYMKDVRARNIGWRIDYALVSQDLTSKIINANVYSDIYGSDHCPIGLEIEMER